jgi:hypothetical protein
MKNKLLYLFLLCIPFLGFSQSETIQETQKSSWEFNVTPYLWMTGMSGDISILDQTTPVDASFSDVLKNLEIAAMVHAEAKKGKWSIMLDYVYANIENTGNVQGLLNERKVTGTIKQNIFELGFAYKFVEVNSFTLEALAGGRYFDIKLNLDFENIESINKGFDFLDPYVGVRFANQCHKFSLKGRIDIGGFGAGSEVSYKYNIFTEYKFSELFQLQLGYQSLTPKYENNNFEYNVTSAGFVLGFNFSL